MRNGNVTLAVCAIVNMSRLEVRRSVVCPRMCVLFLFATTLCKVLSASIYSSLGSVCSVVLCIMPETCVVVCEFQEETCYACVYIFPSI